MTKSNNKIINCYVFHYFIYFVSYLLFYVCMYDLVIILSCLFYYDCMCFMLFIILLFIIMILLYYLLCFKHIQEGPGPKPPTLNPKIIT